ncbi:MAG: DUF937 domain-containing protein [Deltaproteobacteria bacterium]|nr:DUF937 domain-containing protein [Deltaproteobacteria bacterium]
MGLLDDLLGQLTAGPAMSERQVRADGVGSSDMSRVLMALLPVVLAMLGSRRGASEPSAGFGRASAGGLGDILGQILGGAGGAGGAGGLGGLLEAVQRAGFGEQARSWVGSGENQALPAGALEQIFGAGGLAEIARRAGLSEADASRGLERLMPEVVDHVTPGGAVPNGSELLDSVDALARRLGI